MSRFCRFVALAAFALCAAAQVTEIYNNTNIYAVNNQPTGRSAFHLGSDAYITEVQTYHWNFGRGSMPGTITLQLQAGGRLINYGPYRAVGSSGQGGAPNVNWVARVNQTLPAGNYLVLDSDNATWSQNAQSAYRGFVIVRGRMLGSNQPYPGSTPPRGNTAPPPAPTGGPPPGFKPCMVNAGSVGAVGPCFGPPGTIITLVLSRNLAVPPAKLVFRRVLANGVPAAVTAPLSGSGSTYKLAAPVQLCAGPFPRKWDVWLVDASNRGMGEIGEFTMTGCP